MCPRRSFSRGRRPEQQCLRYVERQRSACGVSDNAATFKPKNWTLLVLVVNAPQQWQVLFGETGVAQHLKPSTAVMVSSTIASADAQEIATALAGFDLEMLDAPVSGGAVKAANGEMTVMASGSDIAFERLAPVLEAVAGKVYRIGGRTGTRFDRKNYSPVVSGRTYAAGAEAMALAPCAGIPLDVMYDVVTNAAGNSGCSKTGCVMVDGDYTPHSAVDIC